MLFYLFLLVLVILMFGNTGKVIRYLFYKACLITIAYLSIPLIIVIFAFNWELLKKCENDFASNGVEIWIINEPKKFNIS